MKSRKSMIPETVGGSLFLAATAGPYEGARFPLKILPVTIGRSPVNEIGLSDDRWISGRHCRLYREDGNVFVEDVGSTNGTYVDGARISQPAVLISSRTVLTVGKTQMTLIDESLQREDANSKTLNVGDLIYTGALEDYKEGQKNELEETLFVVDICNSTTYGVQQGEKALFEVVMTISKSLTRNADMEKVQYLQHTGDGFFMTFSSADEALRVAAGLLADLEAWTPESGAPNPGVRVAIHHGKTMVHINDNRVGKACSLIKHLEGVKPGDLDGEGDRELELPERNRVLITGDAVEKLEETKKDRFTKLGKLKKSHGDDPVEVFILKSAGGVIDDCKDTLKRKAYTAPD